MGGRVFSMSEWKIHKLSEVVDIISGGTPKTSVAEYWNGLIPWLSVADFNNGKKFVSTAEKSITELGLENCSSKLLQKNDIIISARGTVGVVAMLEREMAFNQSCYGIRAKENSTNDYIYYFLKSAVKDFLQVANGGVFDTITRQTFDEIEISLPPLEEQKAIAEVLSSLDDKIDLLHRQNQTLEKLAESHFRHLFIDNAQDDWEEGKLGDYITITYGKNLPTNQLLETGYPVFGGNGQIGFFDKFLYSDPQVLVSCRGEASGKVNISLPNSFITNNSLVLVRNKDPKVTFEFLKYFALSYDFSLHVSGSAQPQITIDGLYDAKFLVPPTSILEKFSEITSELEKKKLSNFYQIQNLEKLRDQLLPKLMSGEIKILGGSQ